MVSDYEITPEQADRINIISRFLAVRDLSSLSAESVRLLAGSSRADLLILLGNSVLFVTEQAAKAFQSGIAKEFMIVGGIGHSTSYLIENVQSCPPYSNIDVHSRSEAEILMEVGKLPKTIILMQDPTMQLRTYASFLKAWQEEDVEARFINYAAFVPQLKVIDNQLIFVLEDEVIEPLWSVPRFLSLIMGEISRLYDDENGYGPNGKGYIDHLHVPEKVISVYRELLPSFHAYIRSVG